MARLLLVLTTSLALLAGCGGGDDGDSGGGDGPSREDFVADANAICRTARRRSRRSRAKGSRSSSQASSDKRAARRGRRPARADGRGVPPVPRPPATTSSRPEDLAEEWSNFVDGITEAFDLIPELADATRENDEQKLVGADAQVLRHRGATRGRSPSAPASTTACPTRARDRLSGMSRPLEGRVALVAGATRGGGPRHRRRARRGGRHRLRDRPQHPRAPVRGRPARRRSRRPPSW